MSYLACGPVLSDLLWWAIRPLLFGVTIVGISWGLIAVMTAYLGRVMERPEPNQHRPHRATPSPSYSGERVGVRGRA
jgi:hypothetical protein